MRWAFIYPAPGSEMVVFVEIVWLERRHPYGVEPHTKHDSFPGATGKHLPVVELDSDQAWTSQGVASLEAYARRCWGKPILTTTRRALRGVVQWRGMETRGPQM